MCKKSNPFIRGYWNLHIVRTLSVSYEDGSPHVWRNIHPSQQHLPDDILISSPCIITSEFAVVRNGTEPVNIELTNQCDLGEGIVGAVVYSIHGDDPEGHLIHVGDTYSIEAARKVVQRLNFETGYYSRSWEISTAHISQETCDRLASMADVATPEACMFTAFRIPNSQAIGIKLICTPWTDKNLEYVLGISANQLRQTFLNAGVPHDLANILELAGQADVRILILDADARTLPGLLLAESW